MIPTASTRAPWWRRLVARLFGPPPIVARCSRCGAVRDAQRLPWGTQVVCSGQVNIAYHDEPPLFVCIRLRVVWR